MIPGSGRYTGEGIGYLLQYSWASLVAQLVKNLPAMWETWVRSLGWEDPLEKGKAIHHAVTKSQTQLSNFDFLIQAVPFVPLGAFIPRCNEEGYYKATQCHGSTGQCWCVDKYGNELAGSRKQGAVNCGE